MKCMKSQHFPMLYYRETEFFLSMNNASLFVLYCQKLLKLEPERGHNRFPLSFCITALRDCCAGDPLFTKIRSGNFRSPNPQSPASADPEDALSPMENAALVLSLKMPCSQS